MRIFLIAGLVALSLGAASFSEANAATKCTKSKTSAKVCAKVSARHSHKGHRVAHVRHRRGGAYLIPPPPASMPCILPELYYAKQNHPATGITELAVEKKENPYKKYISTPAGDAPEPVQTRKGVVTWTNRT